jgi:acetyltransferase-like isoleucine patch superfamily enzyme
MNETNSAFNAPLAEQITANREALARFLAGSERKFEFAICCCPEKRIGFIYSVIFPGRKKYRFYWRFFLCRIARAIDYSPLKVLLYRRAGFRIGRGVFISPDVILDPHFPELIEIGDHAIIGWGTHLFAHEFDGGKYRIGRIRIGAGAVIGGFSIVRGGVTIGENANIASTCIVYKDVPDNYYLDSVILLNRALLEVYREERRVEPAA